MSSPMTAESEVLKILTFRLSHDVFAVPITRVREVVELSHVTRLPRTPHFIRGLLNLRGHVIPVVDMRAKLGLGTSPDTVDTCVIVTEVTLGGEATVVGALADAVREVTELERASIVPPPNLGTVVRSDFIEGLGRKEEELIMILDFDRLFSGTDLALPTDADSLTALMNEAAHADGAAAEAR